MFIIQGQEIGAHLNIISHHPVMATMLNEKFVEGQSRQVIINNTEPEIFRQLLHYLYNLLLLMTCHSLNSFSQQQKRIKWLDSNISARRLIGSVEEDNVVRLLVIAHLQSATRLLETRFQKTRVLILNQNER